MPAPAKAEYTALSYVWGDATSQNVSTTAESSQGRPLSSMAELPRVIEDAIALTMAMGLRYLWVDRYCIDQQSSAKHEQIRQMDSIYESAQLTIVAAAGTDPDYGLPGISRRRSIQQTAKMGRCTIISTMRHPSLEISFTKWSPRAWKCQEAVVSRRRLVFTDSQVYFECKTMSCHESLSGWRGLSSFISGERLLGL
ncbi:hypothetical protein C8034_v003502 [Colletotrichum sidae]|uniref:Heterokaryon incompatibility domain-containing protein n=1 Tax=Colletotrichum sidae TaxID=1347389 RepID=A0A4R8T9P6_9PEZI|nr:hypothetical protein C8034_v003502 [Colletotrichum sidae]